MAHLQTLITPLLPFLILLITTQTSLAQPTPKPGPNNPAQDFLDLHKEARSSVGVAPLKWSPPLATSAAHVVAYQKANKNCQFANLSSAATKYGANQLWARGAVVTPRAAVSAWVGEKKYYNYSMDTCIGKHQCGVYKQVVWRKSTELGCAQASCVKDGSTLTVCFYNPPGNIVGEKPY
ncbi:hypothetical protein RND81_13G164100 [Saponaria officinalis]|uniref:SCP domain-containing protein n=1 Tax=Saponaria officinalis TaxID=3572 RepID=A0AAW1H3A5_SAPOF